MSISPIEKNNGAVNLCKNFEDRFTIVEDEPAQPMEREFAENYQHCLVMTERDIGL